MSDFNDFKKGSFICFEYSSDYYHGKVIKNLKYKMVIEITQKNKHRVYRDVNNYLIYVTTNSDKTIDIHSVYTEYEKKYINIKEH